KIGILKKEKSSNGTFTKGDDEAHETVSLTSEASSQMSESSAFLQELQPKTNSDATSDEQEVKLSDSVVNVKDVILPVVHWQSLRNADECLSSSCGAEFATKGERRLHCYRCGKIHCRRCVKMSEDGRERICDSCASSHRGFYYL
uniref:FYVE domain-containing protein n=1 Tax=Syphacia muris TaxID=451379 RepID=A0A0N5AD01_9BILA